MTNLSRCTRFFRISALLGTLMLVGALFFNIRPAQATPPADNTDASLFQKLEQKYDRPGIVASHEQAGHRTASPRSQKPDRTNQTLNASAATQAEKNSCINTILNRRETRPSRNTITNAQRNRLNALAASRNDTVLQVIFDKSNGTPAHIKRKPFKPATGKRSALASKKKMENAMRFLNTNHALMKLKNPEKELVLKARWMDTLGASHLSYQQVYNNIPIFGRSLLVHMDGDDDVYLMNGRYEPTPDPAVTVPEINAAQAAAFAADHLGVPQSDLITGETALVYYTMPDGTLVLTYKLDIMLGINARWLYFINAADGSFVHRINQVQTEIVSAAGTALTTASNSGPRNFNAWLQNGTYYLVDPSLPLATNQPSDPISSIQSPGNTYVLTANNTDGSSLAHITSGASNSGWDPAGVSAMYHIGVIYNYYKTEHNRDGIDNKNMNYSAVVHLGQNYANAFWNGTYIVFGDGDNQVFSNLAGALDITAHEIQHGITQFTAGLVYENQSGALNEAYSDVFACMVDDRNWTVAEDVTLISPYYLRNLAEPAKGLESLPSKMSEYRNMSVDEDNGGVHINMSIPSRAGYLMAEGLDAEGLGTSIGRDKTADIWYRALTTYLPPYAQFTDARRYTIQAAEDLYGSGSTEAAAVQAAWDAVEVTETSTDGGTTPAPSPSPTDGDIVTGDDVLVFLYPVGAPANPTDYYDLYVQLDADNANASQSIVGPLNAQAPSEDRPRYTRPALYTDSAGDTVLFYATEDYDLHYVRIYADGSYTQSQEVLDTGEFYSIALSPDGRYFAYTKPYAGDNNIYVLDLDDQNRDTAFTVVPPDDANDNTEIFNTILYADSLAFDYTSRTLVFDALNCITTTESSCSSGGGYQYWSIGFLTLSVDPDSTTRTKGYFEFPFPNQDPLFDVGYPSFAANNSYVVAVDIIDHTNSNQSIIASMIYTLNWKDRTTKAVASPDIGNQSQAIFGVPSFWGDNSAIVFEGQTATGTAIYEAPLDTSWAGPADSSFSGGNSTIATLGPDMTLMPAMHRRAARSLTAKITYSAGSITFQPIAVGGSESQNLTLTNTSDRDIDIRNIALSGSSDFSHNGTNRILPRNGKMTIQLTYKPSSEGNASASLNISSDADTPTDQISLTGSTSSSTTDTSGSTTTDSGGSSSGNCFIITSGHAPAGMIVFCVLIATGLLLFTVNTARAGSRRRQRGGLCK